MQKNYINVGFMCLSFLSITSNNSTKSQSEKGSYTSYCFIKIIFKKWKSRDSKVISVLRINWLRVCYRPQSVKLTGDSSGLCVQRRKG